MQETVQQNNEQNQVDQKKTTTQKKPQKSSEQHSSQVYQSKQGQQEPPSAPDKQKTPIQAKQKGKGSIKARQKDKGPIQAKRGTVLQRATQATSKSGGLPEPLKSNMEQHSGVDLSQVKVFHNSSKPAAIDRTINSGPEVVQQQKTEAFAQGEEIHLAPGKDQHLPHEAWHVVQQKQGRVKPTQSNGINDDPKLEKEADDMGAKLSSATPTSGLPLQRKCNTCEEKQSIQRKTSTLLTASAPIQQKCSACEAKEGLNQRTIQRKAVTPLSTGLPLQMKCAACEAKAAKQKKTTQLKTTTGKPIQRQCPDCDGEEKLNELTSGDGGPKTKSDPPNNDTSEKNDKKEPKDDGKSVGEVQIQKTESLSPGSDQIASPGENPLAQGLQQKKDSAPKPPTKEGEKKESKKEATKEGKKAQQKGQQKTKEVTKKSKEGEGGPGEKKEDSPTASIEQAQTQLTAASEQALSLQGTNIFFKLPENGPQSEEEKQKMRDQQFQTGYEASNALSSAASQVANLAGLAGSMQQSIQAAQLQAQANIRSAANAQKAAITQQSQQSIAQAVAKATTAKSQVMAQHVATSSTIQVKFQTTKAGLEADYQKALQDLETEKTTQLGNINTVYSTGVKAYKETGRQAGAKAIAEGNERRATYHKGMLYEADGKTEKKDSFTAGYLTNRKVKARKKAAKQVSEAYRDNLVDAANKQAAEAMKGKAKDADSVSEAINTTQEQLKAHYDQILEGLESQKNQALEQANTTKTQLLTGIDQNLQMVKSSLTQQKNAQLQGIDQGTQTQIAQLGAQSESTLATLLSLLGQLTSGLVTKLKEFRDFLNGAPLPDPTALQNLLALVNGKVSANIAETQMAFQTRAQEAVGALLESGQAAGGGLQKVGEKAQQSFNTTLNNYLQGTTASTQSGVKNLQQITTGHGQVTDQLQQSGKKGFEQLVKQTKDAFKELNTNLEKSFVAATEGLKKSLEDAIGQKGSTDKEKMHGLITDKAREAASKEQPAWKSIVKWILIIAVVVVVALVAGPAVIGAIGGFAATMGASAAAASVIGTVVGGAIVGAATSATIQVINNWAAGDNLLKDVGKAAITGAIGGALGGGAGLLIGKVTSSVVGKFVLEAFADVVVDVGTKVAFGDIPLDKLLSFDGDTWKQIGIDALTSTAMSLGTNALTSTKFGKNSTDYFQKQGTNFGDKIGVSLGGTSKINVDTSTDIKPANTETDTKVETETKIEEPKVENTTKTEASEPKVESTTKTETSEPKVENTTKTETSEPKVENTTKTETSESKVESTTKTETSKPKVEEPKVETDIKTKNETPGQDTPVRTENESPTTGSNKRTTHENSPEIEEGGVVARYKTEDGHTVKVLSDGRIIVCSICGDIRMRYAEQLADTTLKNRLDTIEKISDPDLKAQEAKVLRNDLELIKSKANTKAGNELAKEAGLPDAPDGYFWRKGKDGAVHLYRNSSRMNDLPKLIYDPDAPHVAGVPKDFKVAPLSASQYKTMMAKAGSKKRLDSLISKTKNITRLGDFLPQLTKNTKKFSQLLDTVGDIDHILKMNDEFLLTLANNSKLLDDLIAQPALAHQRIIRAYKVLKDHRLLNNMGTASDLDMALTHTYTESSNFLNFPMRGSHPEKVLDLHKVDYDNFPNRTPTDVNFATEAHVKLQEALAKLRKTSRLVENESVYRGRSYEKDQFDDLFASAKVGDEIPLKGYQSASKTEDTPLAFLDKTEGDYKVIMEIIAKEGVDIDDIADYGATLGPINHPKEIPEVQVQQEVLLEEGYFKVLQPPTKTTIKGREVYLVVLEEILKPLNRKK